LAVWLKSIKIILVLLITTNLLSHTKNTFKVRAQDFVGTFSIEMAIDKGTVKGGESFNVAINVKSTSSAPIENLEIRLPYFNRVQDITNVTENPAFNKKLEGTEFPAGFNSRSWLINTFEPGATKTFNLKYTLVENPSSTTDIISKFTYPATWQDPDGLVSNTELTLNYLRVDAYISNNYRSSHKILLPKSDGADSIFAGVKLNQAFYYPGSKSTNLKEITPANKSSFQNFTLETKDVVIKWTDPIDFSSSTVIDKMKKFDELFKVEWGKVAIDTKELSFLSKSAQVTFKGLEFVNEPRIRVGDKVQNLSEANAKWEQNAKSVNLTIKPLKTVAVTPNIIFEKDEIDTEENKLIIKGRTADPKSKVLYKYDAKEYETTSIDLKTGEFEIQIDDASKADTVKVSTIFDSNKEVYEKELKINYKTSEEQSPVDEGTTKNNSYLNNPVTNALLLIALAVLLILGGYVYYLIYRKRKSKSVSNLSVKPVVGPSMNHISSKPTFNKFSDVQNDKPAESVSPPENLKNNSFDKNYLKDD
jgi:hypothetical protein